jgi:hypothetical protein
MCFDKLSEGIERIVELVVHFFEYLDVDPSNFHFRCFIISINHQRPDRDPNEASTVHLTIHTTSVSL